MSTTEPSAHGNAPVVRGTTQATARTETYKQRRARLSMEAKARRLDQRRQIVALVLAGATYAEVGRRLGKKPNTVKAQFVDEMQRTAKATEEARQLHLARLERQILRWWDPSTRSETEVIDSTTGKARNATPEERAERAERADQAMGHLRWLFDQYAKVQDFYKQAPQVTFTGDVTVEQITVGELNAKLERLKRERQIARDAAEPPTLRVLPAASSDA
jgi:hypothetical protein